MSEYAAKQVRLPAAMWEALDRLVDARARTVSRDFFIAEAVEGLLDPRAELRAVDTETETG